MTPMDWAMEIFTKFDLGRGLLIGMVCFVVCILVKVLAEGKNSVTFDVCMKSTLLSIYVVLLLQGTLFDREPRLEYQIRLTPFWSYEEAINTQNTNLIMQMWYNVVLFIPFGILLPNIFQTMRQWLSFFCVIVGISTVIEMIQLFLKLGIAEFDDVFHNTLGAMIGYTIWLLYKRIKEKNV